MMIKTIHDVIASGRFRLVKKILLKTSTDFHPSIHNSNLIKT